MLKGMQRRPSKRYVLKIPREEDVKPDPAFIRAVLAAFDAAVHEVVNVKLPAAMQAYRDGGFEALDIYVEAAKPKVREA
jgi:hypothetical protein